MVIPINFRGIVTIFTGCRGDSLKLSRESWHLIKGLWFPEISVQSYRSLKEVVVIPWNSHGNHDIWISGGDSLKFPWNRNDLYRMSCWFPEILTGIMAFELVVVIPWNFCAFVTIFTGFYLFIYYFSIQTRRPGASMSRSYIHLRPVVLLVAAATFHAKLVIVF